MATKRGPALLLAARRRVRRAAALTRLAPAPKEVCILQLPPFARPTGPINVGLGPAAPVRLRRPYSSEIIPRAHKLFAVISRSVLLRRYIIVTYFGLYLYRLYTVSMGESIHSKEYKEIIQKLVVARIDSGLTQVQAGLKLKKPQSYISKIERRERRIDIVELKQLLKIYKTGLADFF